MPRTPDDDAPACEPMDPAPSQVRAAAEALLALLPSGTFVERCDAARDAAAEALLAAALREADGNRTHAAATLGMGTSSMTERLRRLPHLAEEFPGRHGRPPVKKHE